jgi:heme-degrading monooxygenase HmoA
LIIRVLQGRVAPGQTAIFRLQAQKALDDARRRDGLVYAQVGRQAHSDGSEEISFVSVWRDLAALYAWLGGTDLLDTPVFNSVGPAVFQNYEVQHFESYETDETAAGNETETRFAAALDAHG